MGHEWEVAPLGVNAQRQNTLLVLRWECVCPFMPSNMLCEVGVICLQGPESQNEELYDYDEFSG